MPGAIHAIIQDIIAKRAKGNRILEKITSAKIALKGVVPERYDENSPDDPEVIEKLRVIAMELGVRVDRT